MAAPPDQAEAAEEYEARNGRLYRYAVRGCDGDLDHPGACLFTFLVNGPDRSFEKVIAVQPAEAGLEGHPSSPDLLLPAARARLQRKLDEGNEADEPTPLR